MVGHGLVNQKTEDPRFRFKLMKVFAYTKVQGLKNYKTNLRHILNIQIDLLYRRPVLINMFNIWCDTEYPLNNFKVNWSNGLLLLSKFQSLCKITRYTWITFVDLKSWEDPAIWTYQLLQDFEMSHFPLMDLITCNLCSSWITYSCWTQTLVKLIMWVCFFVQGSWLSKNHGYPTSGLQHSCYRFGYSVNAFILTKYVIVLAG